MKLSHFSWQGTHIADTRGLRYETELPDAPVRGWFDREVLETVVANLLSNALKYTPDGETVRLRLTAGEDRPLPEADRDRMGLHGSVTCRDLTIRVDNTGTYIPNEQRERLFDRFIMAASASMDGNVGSGVGLALVKELMDFMGGEVAVDSDRVRGTRFAVTLPLISTPVADETGDAPDHDAPDLSRSRAIAEGAHAPADVEDATEETDERERPLVLIVEDHPDLRAFLAGELGDAYEVVVAGDGAEGLETARRRVPDLVVSDVMMPNMDGFELLTRLKNDDVTDHVPVILLTAKAEAESRREGLRIGADDYLSKPLDPEELRIRAANLIRQRALLRRKYSSNIDLIPVRDLPLVTREDRFLAQALKVVDEHLGDDDFNVERFAREVGLSRTQLHRKLKAITGRSASLVIRRQRLRRAAELLASGYGNVAEVAFASGFKSLSHFSKNFKEEFGVAPSRYGKDADPPEGD